MSGACSISLRSFDGCYYLRQSGYPCRPYTPVLGSNGYALTCPEGFFSETRLPLYPILGNSGVLALAVLGSLFR